MSAGDFEDSRALLDVGPEVEQEAEVAAELFFAGALGCGADDESAGGFALFAEQNFFQAAAFAVGLDLARDAGVVDRRHEDQEAAGQSDVRGDARALLGDGLLGDLNENLLAGLEQVADGGEVGGLHGAAATTAVATSAGALAVACSAGVAGTVARSLRPKRLPRPSRRPSRRGRPRSSRVRPGRGDGGARLGLVEAVGGGFGAFGELFVDDVLFGVGLVEVFFF